LKNTDRNKQTERQGMAIEASIEGATETTKLKGCYHGCARVVCSATICFSKSQKKPFDPTLHPVGTRVAMSKPGSGETHDQEVLQRPEEPTQVQELEQEEGQKHEQKHEQEDEEEEDDHEQAPRAARQDVTDLKIKSTTKSQVQARCVH
jgi:hypothetical protein